MALFAAVLLSIVIALSVSTVTFSLDIESRITEGLDANPIKFPYLVALRRKSCSLCAFEQFACGAIYSRNIVITAGNAVQNNIPRSLMVVIGSRFRTGGDGLFFPVENLVVHENFNPLNLDNDIALLKLKVDLPLGQIGVAQALKIADAIPVVGSLGLVAGWGHTSEEGDYSEILKQIEVPIVSKESCQKSYHFTKVTENMICAGHERGGKDACTGDSGSPLVVAQQYVGIVSWGIGCGRPNNPGVYTNLVQLHSWIEKTAERM